MQSSLIEMGKIGAPFGIEGWVHVQSYSQPIDNLLQYQTWYTRTKTGFVELPIVKGRVHGTGLVVQIDQVTDRTVAKEYCHQIIWVKRADFAPLPEDEYYWADLEGLDVITQSGTSLGPVAYLYENCGLDVMVIKKDRQEYHIPFVLDDTVVAVDLAAKTITVDWEV